MSSAIARKARFNFPFLDYYRLYKWDQQIMQRYVPKEDYFRRFENMPWGLICVGIFAFFCCGIDLIVNLNGILTESYNDEDLTGSTASKLKKKKKFEEMQSKIWALNNYKDSSKGAGYDDDDE